MPPSPGPEQDNGGLDNRRLLMAEWIKTELQAGAVLAAKPFLGELPLPEPIDLGAHAGNFGMTMMLAASGVALARNKIMGHNIDHDPARHSRLIRKLGGGVFALGLLVNVGIEYAPHDIRAKYSSEQTTSDPLDVLYGVAGGLVGFRLMTRNLRAKQIDPPPKPKQTGPEQYKVAAPKAADKRKRQIQKSSRKNNRKK